MPSHLFDEAVAKQISVAVVHQNVQWEEDNGFVVVRRVALEAFPNELVHGGHCPLDGEANDRKRLASGFLGMEATRLEGIAKTFDA